MRAVALARAFARRDLSPVEATRHALARIERHAALNAFLTIDHDAALAAARASEQRWHRGEQHGPLDGIPVTLKDQFDAIGLASRKGSLTTPDATATTDAPCAARLREAGAVILGKTAMCEFGWKGVTDSPLLGITRNPWDATRSAGGSSGGAAVAAAIGAGAIHIGSDGAGSIRIPAAWCGVFGFKPGFGRVPHHPGGRLGVGHVGPITASVEDAALAMDELARPDPRDPTALPPDARDHMRDLDAGLRGWRIAFSRTLGHGAAEPETLALCEEAVRVLDLLGAHVEEVEPALPDPAPGFGALWRASMGHAMAALAPAGRALLDPGYVVEAQEGLGHDAATIFRAMGERQEYSRAMAAFMQPYELLVTPTMPIPAIEAGRDVPEGSGMRGWLEWSPFTYGFNWTGQPAASIPCGLTRAGLPVGLQLVGRRFADTAVLRAARALERAMPWRLPA